MRHRNPWPIFLAAAVMLTIGYGLNSPVDGGSDSAAERRAEARAERRADERTRRQWEAPAARPRGDRVLAERSGLEAQAAERRGAARDPKAETVGVVDRFVTSAFWLVMAGVIAVVIWKALWAPVLWRQRR
jgi:hypothetical protein